jgi:predicted esterase
MRRIFISYAREDRDYAHTLANALSERGYEVWWDWNLVFHA